MAQKQFLQSALKFDFAVDAYEGEVVKKTRTYNFVRQNVEADDVERFKNIIAALSSFEIVAVRVTTNEKLV